VVTGRSSVGQVVDKVKDPATPAVDTGEEQLPLPDVVRGEWTSLASVADQWTDPKWANDVRPGVERVEVFALPDEQEKANALFARAHPPGCPQIVILRREPLRSAGRLVLFVLYQEIEYRKLLPRHETEAQP